MKKNRLFRCFIAIVNMVALTVPVIVLGYNCVANALNLHFASQSVQHHGGTSDVFSNDLDYAVNELTPYDMNKNILDTLDNFNYLNYDSVSRYVPYNTNDVEYVTDLVIGNVYLLSFTTNVGTSVYRSFFGDVGTFGLFNGNLLIYDSDFLFSYTYQVVSNTGSNYLYGLTNNSFNFWLFGAGGAFEGTSVVNNVVVLYYGGLTSLSSTVTISSVPSDMLPLSYVESDLSSLAEWKDYFNGSSYHTIIENGTKNNFLINYDFGNIFFNDSLTNINGNIAPYLMFNFCINYFINISLLLFIPEILLILLDFMKSLLYRFLDKSEV